MSAISPLQPQQPRPTDTELKWGNLFGSSSSLAIANLASQANHPIVVLTKDIHTAHQLQHELRFYSSKALTILLFPDWETLPYDHFSPHEDLISERLWVLYKLSQLSQGIIIAALPTLMHRLLPSQYLHAHTFAIACNELLDLTSFRQQLLHNGYQHVEQVMQHGEFAVRGSIIDLYPMGSHIPYRIELFDNEIESIRSFDPDTQKSLEKQTAISLLPAREYPLTPEGITQFRQAWRARFAGNPKESPLYQHISAGEAAAGIEYFLPLFFSQLDTFFDYLHPHTTIALVDNLPEIASHFWQEVQHRHEQLRYDITRPICPPEEVFLPVNQLFAAMKPFTQVHIKSSELPQKPGISQFATAPLPALQIDHKNKQPLERLKNFLDSYEGRVLLVAETAGRREILQDLLHDIQIKSTVFTTWHDFLSSDARLGIIVAPLDQGLLLNSPAIALITESQLFGSQVMQRRLRKKRQQDPSTMIRNLTELSIGEPVVHIEHGVGRYRGLKLIATGDIEAEYLTLEYANNDKIYVPVSSLHLISRYTGADNEHAPLQKLGSKQWSKAKEKTAQQIRDVAAELLEIYSRRQATTGFAFKKPNAEFQAFRNAFPFEETADQTSTINAVIDDMTAPRSMDRLVCGDVGFGKTEVAMQAAFLAAQSNKQVAILVPTTLLATQHLQNFRDRYSDWPIKIAALSRLVGKKEQDRALEQLKNGQLDIIIGTHRLLGQDIHFKDLGLLIVDEEHRFGVRQKERIKSLRAHVDILTLTATPIPRTLNLALAGTRDLSIIATPPARRLSIKTFVHENQPNLIREALLRETMRGGQLYFLHNDIATIQATAEKLRTIAPDARIAIAHGQMPERELERIMSDFYHQKYNVLVCTTIIESGIDIPTANTIIINHANRFGLAQLHQLRGRVGRSHHQAYAYLIVANKKALTKDANKRLDAISHLEDLGAGFNLASHDLEIRGAGEILGEEQSGHIQAIGYHLYMELLEDAVAALKSGKEPTFEKSLNATTEVDLHTSALIPEHYVHDVHSRLTLYKRLSCAQNKTDVQNLKAELVDRFGTLPESTQELLKVTELKIVATPLGIKKIDLGHEFGYIHFNDKPNINPMNIIQLIQKQPKRYQMQGANKLRFKVDHNESQQRFNIVKNLLDTIKASTNN